MFTVTTLKLEFLLTFFWTDSLNSHYMAYVILPVVFLFYYFVFLIKMHIVETFSNLEYKFHEDK